MTTTLFAMTAALLVAVVYFADPASAGGSGATLNFGGPLGNFTAQQGDGETAKGPDLRRRTVAPKPRLVRGPAIANNARPQPQSVPVPVRSAEVAPVATDRREPNSHLPTATVSAMAALDKPLSEIAEEARSGQAARATEAAEEQTCKKYVAAAGLTITVPCAK